VAWSSDDRYLAAASGNEVVIWDSIASRQARLPTSRITKAATWNTQGLLAVGDDRGTIQVIADPTESKRSLATFALDSDIGADGLRWSPDGSKILAATAKGIAVLELREQT
jgi:WD40 repeat protein